MSGDIWAGAGTDRHGFDAGQQILTNVHPPEACAGRACVLHNPSDHHMRAWPTYWRSDIPIMERTCPHGIGHPDPDDLAYQLSVGREGVGIHGCDGCCRNAP